MSGSDTLDELDRKIVVALQSAGRASWTEIAELCGTSVTTVARRGQQLLKDGTVRVAVTPHINHAGATEMYLLRITCAPGTQSRVCAKLAVRSDVRFLALVTGPWDIIAELNLRRDESLHTRIVEDILAIDGVLRCDTDLTLHVYKVSHDWSRQLLTGEPGPVVNDAHECDPSHFDPADLKIIDWMREDGRASFRAVADALGVNESTVRRRFETLQRRGCVHVTTHVPARALGFESEIVIYVTVAPRRLEAVARELSQYRGVRYVGALLGTNSLMCEVILPTTQDVYTFTTGTLAGLDGVQGWTASMILVTVRRGFVETPWWRDAIADPAR
ncbi:Lrp/AsnC family transcriptional regulator [Dactylosporangium sp. CA-092794]|uniref:Lrp/AsnC family transcriptional regulator n=1 Tax=Dactylosporangium sp. CA-092794 TaxID=3239929 RepID=UPI003D926C90